MFPAVIVKRELGIYYAFSVDTLNVDITNLEIKPDRVKRHSFPSVIELREYLLNKGWNVCYVGLIEDEVGVKSDIGLSEVAVWVFSTIKDKYKMDLYDRYSKGVMFIWRDEDGVHSWDTIQNVVEDDVDESRLAFWVNCHSLYEDALSDVFIRTGDKLHVNYNRLTARHPKCHHVSDNLFQALRKECEARVKVLEGN